MYVILQFATGICYEVARYQNEFDSAKCGAYEIWTSGDKKKQARPLGSLHIPKDSPDYIDIDFALAPGAGSKGEIVLEITAGSKYKFFTIFYYLYSYFFYRREKIT